MPRIDLIQIRNNTASAAATNNPILDVGEPGFETDTGVFKIGDGVTAWNDLPAISGEGGGGPTIIETSASTVTVDNDDNNTIILCLNATGTTITLPNTVSQSTYVTAIRGTGAGPVVFASGGTAVLNGLTGVLSAEADRTISEEGGWASWVKRNSGNDWYGTGMLGELTEGVGGGTGAWADLTGDPTDNTAFNAFITDLLADIDLLYRRKVVQFAASDETTALTTGTGKITLRMPHAMTLTAVRASLTTPQTSGSVLTVDINEGGSTILSTKLTFDNGEKTTTTAATPAVISDTALADDAEITVDIDQVGDGTAKGLKITLIGY